MAAAAIPPMEATWRPGDRRAPPLNASNLITAQDRVSQQQMLHPKPLIWRAQWARSRCPVAPYRHEALYRQGQLGSLMHCKILAPELRIPAVTLARDLRFPCLWPTGHAGCSGELT